MNIEWNKTEVRKTQLIWVVAAIVGLTVVVKEILTFGTSDTLFGSMVLLGFLYVAACVVVGLCIKELGKLHDKAPS